MKGLYWVILVIVLLAGAAAYVGFEHRPKLLALAGIEKPTPAAKEDSRNPQEKLADSIAQQQALAQQANQAASASANEVQRNLKTIEDINRMNRMNQQLQQQQQSKIR